MLERELVPQLVRRTNQNRGLAGRLQYGSPAQQLGIPDAQRLRSSVATPFVLGSLNTPVGTVRKAFPNGALTRGLDGRTRLQRTTIMRTKGLRHGWLT